MLPLLVSVRLKSIGCPGGSVDWLRVFTPLPEVRGASTARVAQALPAAVPVLLDVSACARQAAQLGTPGEVPPGRSALSTAVVRVPCRSRKPVAPSAIDGEPSASKPV
jgi:hypothetical protein